MVPREPFLRRMDRFERKWLLMDSSRLSDWARDAFFYVQRSLASSITIYTHGGCLIRIWFCLLFTHSFRDGISVDFRIEFWYIVPLIEIFNGLKLLHLYLAKKISLRWKFRPISKLHTALYTNLTYRWDEMLTGSRIFRPATPIFAFGSRFWTAEASRKEKKKKKFETKNKKDWLATKNWARN